MTTQLALIENPSVDADAHATFLRRWAELGGGDISVTLCVQRGERWCVLAWVDGKERVAFHKPSVQHCAEAIYGGTQR